ncbi:uncharacterized protein PV09_09125 [Verruconis gallopava]|uniref:Prenyltransferase alpha-alpha toroid domain-containing protein n=1 Tax=Verruconis gallopava TaxID=253628 RepID=A0A0D1YEL7_9PEZI|nr:uncharacterized protein PV09_09125 [Verruconis gallopava]KIV99171.1 hypothetical protein PV09_09125 [Verruconis gallopava]
MSPQGPLTPQFERQKHILYWKRCLRTYLPNQYTTMDANRMMLAYFTILSLDILGSLDSTLSSDERQACIDWIYLCQHRDGGFRGSPPPAVEMEGLASSDWDVATVPATFFALSMLAMLKDDFMRVKRKECLCWLLKMQRPDGSFGEHLGEGGAIEGGMDTRFGFCAAGVRWILRGRAVGDVEGVKDVDVDALIKCIRRAQTFDGGVSEMIFHEPHGGYTYCALAALALTDGLPKEIQTPYSGDPSTRRNSGLSDVEFTTHWLVSRQTSQLNADGEEPDDDDDDDDDDADDDNDGLIDSGRDQSAVTPLIAGFNGRCNKPADTCYAFWIGGSLSLLSRLHLASLPSSRNYLLTKTQHTIGGFAKKPGDPPDIYHSALGLAALALMGEEGLKGVNPALCLSFEACSWIESLEWRRNIWAQKEN